jgi:hypothetical protein
MKREVLRKMEVVILNWNNVVTLKGSILNVVGKYKKGDIHIGN